MPKITRRHAVLTAFSGFMLAGGTAGQALTINLTFDHGGAGGAWTSVEQGVMLQAVSDWESVILDAVTVDVTADKVSGESYLGQWSGSISAPAGATIRPWQNATHAIHMDAADNFFWDATPGDAGADQPFAQFDALSVARHEIGHMLGFASNFYRDDAFTAGQSFPWNEQITTSGGVSTFDAGGLNVMMDAPDNLGHLSNSGGTAGDLMVPALANGQRRDISQTDLDMLALAYGYQIIPEPGSLALIGLGGLTLMRRRRSA